MSDDLTPRELEILTLLAQGYSNAEIAETLCVECLTVRSHTNNIYSKMAVANRTQANAMRYDARLAQAAQTQADWLAVHDFADDPHVGAGGSTANERVAACGYRLPEWWPAQGNMVESVTRSWDAPDEAARDLAAHGPHRDHLLSQGWFAEHTHYGLGHAAEYYVFVTAPLEYQ